MTSTFKANDIVKVVYSDEEYREYYSFLGIIKRDPYDNCLRVDSFKRNFNSLNILLTRSNGSIESVTFDKTSRIWTKISNPLNVHLKIIDKILDNFQTKRYLSLSEQKFQLVGKQLYHNIEKILLHF